MIAQEILLKEISNLTLIQIQELTQYIQFIKFKNNTSEIDEKAIESQADEEVTYQPKNVDTFDMTKTNTWGMGGALKIAEPKAKYIVGRDKEGKPITNYAQHVDEILYSR